MIWRCCYHYRRHVVADCPDRPIPVSKLFDVPLSHLYKHNIYTILCTNFNKRTHPPPHNLLFVVYVAVVVGVVVSFDATKIIMDDSNTRPMYETYLKKYQEARNEVAKRKLQIAPPVSSGKGKGKGKDQVRTTTPTDRARTTARTKTRKEAREARGMLAAAISLCCAAYATLQQLQSERGWRPVLFAREATRRPPPPPPP